ncbi:hypothetical protein DSO57_1005431 [Entomophthora muscae]|uniref:Uncharacterized protein n=1 Tax=Entomophthora muscae TaxID=34485 RepID=A0ACC2SKQ4_9FUNG|nr:hypothetical protein DSO57_1005431 [Entomophthora muscae]
MITKCCPIKLPPWRQSSLKLCQRKVMTIRVKGRIMEGWTGWTWICHTTPRSQINNAICIHVNNLSKGTIKQCKDAIYKALDEFFPNYKVDSLWLAAKGYLDIGFSSQTLQEEALDIEIYNNDTSLRIETTRYIKQRAKWVTFSNLLTNQD